MADSASAFDWRELIRRRLQGTEPHHLEADWLLPGLTAEQSRVYRKYFPEHPVPAAVLVPLVEREKELTVLLTQRATQLRNHAGQISFPGGSVEPGDDGPRATALREAHEEIGLQEDYVSVVGYLPDHIVITGFRVTPVVAFVRPGFELLLDTQEVQDTFEVPLSHVFEPSNHRTRKRSFGAGEMEIELSDIPYGAHNIWGATAGMLITLYRICLSGSEHV